MHVGKECSPEGGGGGGGGGGSVTFHSNAVFSIEGLIMWVHLFCSDLLFLFRGCTTSSYAEIIFQFLWTGLNYWPRPAT